MEHEFKLIDTTYSPTQAKELLTKMIKEKMNFFKLMDLAHYSRYQEDLEHISNRIKLLSANMEEIQEFFSEFSDDYDVEVYCPVQIKVRKKEDSNSGSAELVAENY